MDVERLVKLGEKLELRGEALRQWVATQIKEEEERKEKERERLREEEAINKSRAQRQEALLDRELELFRLKSDLQTSSANESGATDVRSTIRTHPVKSPRLPYFDEGKDQMDSYLLRFERYATINDWDKEDWAIYLSSLLKGRSLDVYTRLSDDEAGDYDFVKSALLKRYNLTDDGFNEKFRRSRPENGERFDQFATRIKGYLEKWIELAGKDKGSAEDILDLMLKEQLVNVCSKDLVTFIKERKPRTAKEVTDLGEKYVEAHGVTRAFAKSGLHQDRDKGTLSQISTNKGKNDNRPSHAVVCHNCRRPGHIARECRARKQVAAVSPDLYCQYCHKKGHLERACWKKKRCEPTIATPTTTPQVSAITADHDPQKCTAHNRIELKCGCEMPLLSAACTGHVPSTPDMPVANGWLNGRKVKVLRDSGSSCVIIRKGLVTKRSDEWKPRVMVYLANGTAVAAPHGEAYLECPYFTGRLSAIEMETPLYDVILGNIEGAKCPGTLINAENRGESNLVEADGEESGAVQTRAQRERKVKGLLTAPSVETGVTADELKFKQANDDTLKAARESAVRGDTRSTGKYNTSWYTYDKGLLVRYFHSPKIEYGDLIKQVVVPKDLRIKVMCLAHESILSGHLAAKKTTERVLSNFYWPNVWEDVKRFCQSCDQCQRSTPKGLTPKVPLSQVPLIDEPFSRVAVDLIGPILPASDRGNRYILTVVDYCTRYPEAIALKSIDTERVAEGLVDIFSRTGIPKEMLSDRGTQFTSELMKEVCRLLSINQLSTTPYHPQANGLVERFNATLKSMLKRLAADRPSDWDRYINAALFSYREAPQESLGFSPFELLFGRPVRGPMKILRELWTKEIDSEEVKTTYQYVVDLREKMETVIKAAHESLRYSSARYKSHFDRKAKARSFEKGEKVLLLLPTKHNKLELKWQGPFEVQEVVGPNNYAIVIGNNRKTYHTNLLKKYFEREQKDGKSTGVLECAVAAVIEDEDSDEDAKIIPRMELPALKQTENKEDVIISESLDLEKQLQLRQILEHFDDILTDVPGRTDRYVYDIKLTSDDPIRRKPYAIPQALKATLKEEVEAMLQSGIIEPSESAYCSPSVVVKKKDGGIRYCVDFRALNNITIFDAEPMPRLDELFQEIGPSCSFVSKIDLTKGFWQIPLSARTKEKTAFATELGLMQFTVLPFGLQGAPSAFSRMMRIVLKDLPNVKNYIDDILIHTTTWDEHLKAIQSVFQRLREAGLTAKPSKCLFGFPQVEFLGHIVGNGQLKPSIDKVKSIQEAIPPTNKKQMRSFLGLASFYRRYVPNFSAIAAPLTDCTRKGMPNRITWEEPQERAFETLKTMLTSDPVLHLPDFDKTFILSTDASDTGLGAVLMQEHDGEKFPVTYLSRKLLPREQRYSVVEKECLAVVWAIKSLNVYLIGREFVIETDHAPLLYLNKAKSENGRLMRWSLLLHQYRFTLRSVKGTDNHGPDYLSRSF